MHHALQARSHLLIAMMMALLAALLLPSGTAPAQAQPTAVPGRSYAVADPVSLGGSTTVLTKASPVTGTDKVAKTNALPTATNNADAIRDPASGGADRFPARPVVNNHLQGLGSPDPVLESPYANPSTLRPGRSFSWKVPGIDDGPPPAGSYSHTGPKAGRTGSHPLPFIAFPDAGPVSEGTTRIAATGACATDGAVPDSADNPGLVADCETLLALKSKLAGTGSLNWSSNVTIRTWEGIGLGGTPERVTVVGLGDNRLDGTIPPELASLPRLETLSLGSVEGTNRLTGPVPPELGRLSNLMFLDLGNNQLTGVIPAELGNLSNLVHLLLYSNQLTGQIPPELGNLSNLTTLDLDSNQLTGVIPTELGSLSNLDSLYLSNNKLKGMIPTELGNLSNLEGLYLHENQLTGTIPGDLGSLSGLLQLSLNSNQLTGTIPRELGNLSNLDSLFLQDNRLTGAIPTELARLSNLEQLFLAGNQFTGCIPASLGNVAANDLAALDLSYCSGSGELGAPTRLTATVNGPTQIALSWNAPSDEGSSAITGYRIEVSTDGSSWGVLVPNTGSTATSYSHTGLPAASTRYYRVSAINSTGTGPASNVATTGNLVDRYDANDNGAIDRSEVIQAINDYLFGEGSPITRAEVIQLINLYLFGPTPSPTAQPPGAPTGLTATASGPTGIDLSWSAPSSDGGAAITGYRIEVSENGSTWTDLVANTGNAATSYSHTGLTAGTTRHYRVSAINSAGMGPASNIATGTTETGLSAPTNQRYSRQGSTTVVSWDAVAGADYYNVYHDDFSGCRLFSGSPSFCEELATNVVGTSYTHINPDDYENYYWVTACNRGGCSEIDSDNPATFIDTRPSSPTNQRYSWEGTTTVVGWDAVAGADYYNVYHDDFFDSGCRLFSGSPSFCEELATDVVGTSYTHAQPSRGRNHYWVTACNRGGCSEIDSDNPAPLAGSAPGPDLVVDPPEVSDSNPAAGTSFTLSATVRNQGDQRSSFTILRFYRSTDGDITTSDTQVGSAFGTGLNPSGSSPESITVSVPRAPGTYYYGACVGEDFHEAITDNNCSSAVAVAVTGLSGQGFAPPDEPAFNVRMVGVRLNAGSFYVDFVSEGRFIESGRHPGGYTYTNTGANAGTLVLTYDDEQTFGGNCTVQLTYDSPSQGAWSYTCSSGLQDHGNWQIPAGGVRFSEGGSATRRIPENTPGGINVGSPVAARGGSGALTYSIEGTDVDSFAIVPETGQIRTREDVTYDYETKRRYAITLKVEDGNGGAATIDVAILITNLVPACTPPQNLRVNGGDRSLRVNWDPVTRRNQTARVLGYEIEMRRGTTGAWGQRRTILGRDITGTIYAELENGTGYQVRVRAVNLEGDCAWSPPESGTPTDALAPQDVPDLIDRVETRPVGSPNRNWRFLTPGRCRYAGSAVSLDANCRYENTGTDTGRIFLVFDDPSRGSCEVTLAYSSLTAGSFIDECFDAGVNTSTPFDTSLRMPGQMPPAGNPLPLAPRNADEFNELVLGRDDFIPGLTFGSICRYCGTGGIGAGPGWASRLEYDADDRTVKEFPGRYTYRNTGPSTGELVFEQNNGDTYVFDLEFEPSGNVRATTTDPSGSVVTWPGMLHATLELGALPILLPIPPSWSAAIAAETDAAPADYDGFNDRLQSSGPDDGPGDDTDLAWHTLWSMLGGGDYVDAADRVAAYGSETTYEKIGRNRAQVTVVFDDRSDTAGEYDERPWMGLETLFVNSKWVFDITFVSPEAVRVTATLLQRGEAPISVHGFIDFTGGRINLNEFPDELTLPDDPPQESGADISGVEVAAAVSTSRITGSDLQTFLVSAPGLQTAGFRPGDWLEPKDGSNQRMMITSVGQNGAGARDARTINGADKGGLGGPRKSASSRMGLPEAAYELKTPERPPLTAGILPRVEPAQSTSTESSIIQVSVVCMQINGDIPTRGSRYFSQPKTAVGPVQTCQRNCVLTGANNIQSCVWRCE